MRYIAWFGVKFGIDRILRMVNCTRLHLVQFNPLLAILLMCQISFMRILECKVLSEVSLVPRPHPLGS